MCVSNLMFIRMDSEDVNILDVIHGVDELDVSTSNPQDVSNPEFEDVFKDIDFDCSSELSSLSDEEQDTSKSSDTQIRKHLVIGKHIQVIDGEQKKYKCTICKCQFSWKHQIRYHDYCVTGKRPLKCELCDKRFVKKSHLIYHTRTHSGESPYQCSICPKNFKQLGKLKRHEKVHKEPREADKFQCSVCEKNYCDRDSLKKHERKHDKSKNLQCKHCKKKYVDKFTLKQHLATHQVPKFICEVCGRRFRRKNSLNIHLQMHEDVYPYQCSNCRKTFRTKKELNQHKVVHDKNNPGFECSLCSVMCGRKDNLLRHVRNCHLDPCAKKEQKPKKTPEDSPKNDVDNEKELPTDTANRPLSVIGELSLASSVTIADDSSETTGLMNKDLNVKKKTHPVIGKKSNKLKGKNKINKKKETKKSKRTGTIDISESIDSPTVANPSFINEEEQVPGEDKSENLKVDRKSVLITTSTISETPVNLSRADAVIPGRSQNKDFSLASVKTSVIVHTSSLHGSLIHEANAHREPVIKFFKPSSDSNSIAPDPT